MNRIVLVIVCGMALLLGGCASGKAGFFLKDGSAVSEYDSNVKDIYECENEAKAFVGQQKGDIVERIGNWVAYRARIIQCMQIRGYTYLQMRTE